MQVLAEKRAAVAEAQAMQAAAPPPSSASTARLEELAEQILQELQKRDDQHNADFSISKLLAGIVQIIALAVLLLAYALYHGTPETFQSVLLIAVFLQSFTIALLIMGRQR